MPACHRCQSPVSSQAVTCPRCQAPLKAHGHPGIPLYRAPEGAFLCDRCAYHADDTCNFPQRPYARSCPLFVDRERPWPHPLPDRPSASAPAAGRQGWRRYRGLLLVLAVVAASLLLAL